MTPSTEMIERVARAIAGIIYDPGRPRTEELSEACARAAIEAMRGPTGVMICAGLFEVEACAETGTISAPCLARHIWPAMIDAALSTKSNLTHEPTNAERDWPKNPRA